MRFRNFYGILCGIDIAMDHAGNRRRSGTP
jgi:hypothetical protein